MRVYKHVCVCAMFCMCMCIPCGSHSRNRSLCDAGQLSRLVPLSHPPLPRTHSPPHTPHTPRCGIPSVRCNRSTAAAPRRIFHATAPSFPLPAHPWCPAAITRPEPSRIRCASPRKSSRYVILTAHYVSSMRGSCPSPSFTSASGSLLHFHRAVVFPTFIFPRPPHAQPPAILSLNPAWFSLIPVWISHFVGASL